MKGFVFDLATELFSDEFRNAHGRWTRLKLAPKMRLGCLYEESKKKHSYFTERTVASLIDILSRATR